MYVLINVAGGLITNAIFYQNKDEAMTQLNLYSRIMNQEEEDIAVYDENGLVANAKMLLGEKE